MDIGVRGPDFWFLTPCEIQDQSEFYYMTLQLSLKEEEMVEWNNHYK